MANNSFKSLDKKYGELSDKMRKAIEKDVKLLLKENKGTHIRFKEAVFIRMLNDNDYHDLRGVEWKKKDGLVFHTEQRIGDHVDEFEEGLEEMDASACYEILLALNEKSYNIE